ncbi:C1q-like domain-containing protein [Streptomyces sp.]|uniref:C1q-like domain-containing protein n=1 Tax=Streptomyces sp. TaxID=1931 RepID=UPI002F938E4E
MNVEMRDVLGYFLRPPMCIVRKDGSAQTVPGQATVVASWDTVVYDNDGMFGVDGNRFTCKTPGYYVFSWQLQFYILTPSGGGLRKLELRQYNANAALIDKLEISNVQVQQSDESYAGSSVVGLNASDYVMFHCVNWDNPSHQIVGYEPSQNQYGCQVSARWLSTL